MDELRIRKFLTERIGFKDFCGYYQDHVEQEEDTRRPDLDYAALHGEDPGAKARYLVRTSSQKGKLEELIFYLTKYWFKKDGAPKVLLNEGLHEDLCMAGQEIWQANHSRSLKIFDWLADIHKDFGKEWPHAREALSDFQPLGATKGVADFVAHLAKCRELYEQAGKAEKAGEWTETRRILEELNELQPEYRGITNWLDKINENLQRWEDLYNQAKSLIESAQWEKAKKVFRELEELQPNYRDVQNWLQRIDEHCEKCEDLYKQATELAEKHQWMKARRVFFELNELQPDYRDIPDRLRILNNEDDVRRLQKIIDAARVGFVYDERLPWKGDYPYCLFREFWAPECFKLTTSFNLTKQSLEDLREDLRKENIPDNILKDLKPLIDQEIKSENTFLEAVEKQVGADKTVRYKKLILKHAINSSFQELKNNGISDAVLKSLKNLEDKEFTLEKEFLDAVENQIGKEQTDKYKRLILRYAGAPITPTSSMDDVQEEIRRLDNQKKLSLKKRNSLETLLKSAEQRLFVDIFLYPACPSEDTALSFEKTFLEDGQFPTSETIVKQYPEEEVTILLLLLDRPEGVLEILKATQQSKPTNGKIAHFQALLYLAQAYEGDAHDPERILDNWRRTISHWAVSLADTGHWVKWGRERYQCYGQEPVFTAIVNLEGTLKDYLVRLLQDNSERIPKSEDITQPQLLQELSVEFAAVRLSQGLGGISIEPGRVAWFGPLWMTQYNLQDVLAKHIAGFVPDESMANQLLGKLSPEEAFRRLRWYFSYLRTAAILLEDPGPDPKAALTTLAQSDCKNAPECNDPDCPLHRKPSFPVVVCCPHWDQFVAYNPAYQEFPSPQEQMCEDALHFALAAHLQLAYQQMGASFKLSKQSLQNLMKEDIPETILEDLKPLEEQEFAKRVEFLDVIEKHIGQEQTAKYKDLILKYADKGEAISLNILEREWQEMFELAGYSRNPADLCERLHTIVLEETRSIPLTLGRLSASITILEVSLKMLEAKDPVLKARLVQLLDRRGILKLTQGDMLGADTDLRQALIYAPDRHEIREKLVNLWITLAGYVVNTDRFQALDYLRQAVELIEEGQKKYPGYDWDKLSKWIETSRKNLIGQDVYSQKTDGQPSGKPGDADVYRKFSDDNGATTDPVKLYGQGVTALRENRLDLALKTFRRALEFAPDDVDIQTKAAEAVLAKATPFIEQDDREKYDTGLALIRKWIPDLPTQSERFERQLEFLKWWSHIRDCLKIDEDLFYKVNDYREVWILSEGQHVDPVMVRMEVKDNDLCLSTSLPVIPSDQIEGAFENLLIASSEIMLFKLALSTKAELALKIQLPAFYLVDPKWFFLIIDELSDFADISLTQLSRLDDLRAWFREKRAEATRRIQNSDHLAISGRSIERLHQEHPNLVLAFERVTGDHYNIRASFAQLEMKAWPDGARLSTCLGKLRVAANHQEMLESLVKRNDEFRESKLALDANMMVILSIELPYLDDQAALKAFNLLQQQVVELTIFRLTEQSLKNLRNEGIPDKILKDLKHLQNQEVTGENEFIEAVKKQIGQDQTVKYKELILKHVELRPEFTQLLGGKHG